MSKEMAVLVLGIWVVAVPFLGVPGPWRTALLVLTGIGLVLIGFFLRAEALGGGSPSRSRQDYPFVENTTVPHTPAEHEHKDGITSLN